MIYVYSHVSRETKASVEGQAINKWIFFERKNIPKLSARKKLDYIDSDVFFFSDIVDLTDSWDFFLIF